MAAKYLNTNGINCKKINKVREGSPHIVESLNAKNIELVINTTEGSKSVSDSYSLRRSALVNKIPYCTSLAAANACIEAINSLKNKKITVKTIPYKNNYGYFFTSGLNTWHGMEKKEIKKERRCLQVNYVSFKTDWKVQS